MDLLKTILVYLTMVFVSSVQTVPEPTPAPVTPTPAATATYAAATATPGQTETATPVPTPAITPNSAYKTLKVGDKGDNVTLLQRRLAELGYYTGEVDGVFGNQTRRSVERFQYYQGLSVDGIAGKRTLTVLYESTEVVFAPVEVTPSPSATAGGPTVAITPPTQTPAPTFAPSPTPSATPSPIPATPTASATVTAVLAETIAVAANASPPVLAAAEPQLSVDFVLEGTSDPLTLMPASTTPDAETALVPLHPMLVGEQVFIPILEILRDAGFALISGADTARQEVAFSVLTDLYQLTYTLDSEGNIADLQVLKNREPQVLALRNALVAEGVLYLPQTTVTAIMQIAFTLDENGTRYTVVLPQPAVP